VRATVHRKNPVVLDGRIEYVTCDLLKREDCTNIVEGMEYVFLCAANTSGAAGMQSSPLAYLTPNVIMNMHMLEAAYAAHVEKVLFISSSTIYRAAGDRPLKEAEAFDGDPYEKYFPVGWMNRFCEVLCRIYSEQLRDPIKTVVLRPTNIYGEYDDFEFATAHVLPALIRKVVERHSPIEVWGNGNDVRDLIYVDDFIDAVLLAMAKVSSYCPINIGLGRGYSVKQVLQMILEVDGYTDAKIEFDTSKPSMIPVRLVDTTKAETLLGFEAKTDLREGIGRTIQWFRQQTASRQ